MLEFEDEVDPESIEAATKAHPQRPQIMPPNVEDLNLMDAAGGMKMHSLHSTLNFRRVCEAVG
jgi:hypothetical protein